MICQEMPYLHLDVTNKKCSTKSIVVLTTILSSPSIRKLLLKLKTYLERTAMSKLTRTVSGQTITFLALPRIFQSLAVDLPTGAIKLSTGEVAYWRLNRNLTELKNNRSSHRSIAETLAQALRSLVLSEAFMNHYGLAKSPELPNEANLTTTFRALLALNNTRTDYTSTYYGRNKPLIESITVPLSNMVYFNATRGSTTPPPRQAGLKGTLWLRSKTAEGEVPFRFTIISPHVLLPNHINEERLSKEILTKIIQNLPIMVNKPTIEFDEGQFDSYIGSGLQALVEKTAHAPNGAGKKKGALVKPPAQASANSQEGVAAAHQRQVDHAVADLINEGKSFPAVEPVLGPDAYASLSTDEQAAYLSRMSNHAKIAGDVYDKLRHDFMFSGILEKEWKESCADTTQGMVVQSHEYFLGCVLGLAESAIANAITLHKVNQAAEQGRQASIDPNAEARAIAAAQLKTAPSVAEATAQVYEAIADAKPSAEKTDEKIASETDNAWLKESFARSSPTAKGGADPRSGKLQNSSISGESLAVSVDATGELISARGLDSTIFLATHVAENFREGTWAMVSYEGNDSLVKLVQQENLWVREEPTDNIIDVNEEDASDAVDRREPHPVVNTGDIPLGPQGIQGETGENGVPAVFEEVEQSAVVVNEKPIGWKFWVHNLPTSEVSLAFDDSSFAPPMLEDGETAFVKGAEESVEDFHARAKKSLLAQAPEGYDVVGIQLVADFDENGNMISNPAEAKESNVEMRGNAISIYPAELNPVGADHVLAPADDGGAADLEFKLPA